MKQSLFNLTNAEEIISLPLVDATVWYIPALFSKEAAKAFFQQLVSTEVIEWRQEHVKLFGRLCQVPRLTAWYGDPDAEYHYTGLHLKPLPWCSPLLEIKHVLEKATNESFNSVLLNYYRNGADSVGWHSDDEPELGVNPVIASISFGAERDFVIRHKDYKTMGMKPVKMTLASGSCLMMAGTTQQFWQHQIPKRSLIKVPDGRVNLTFRSVITTSQ